MKTSKFLIFFLSIMFAFPSMAVAYGEGTTQGAVKSGLDSGKICRCESLEEVRQGYKWNTRPEAMKKSPYEAVSSFWDAEQSLLIGYEHGAYTKEEMIEIFQWLKKNKFFISDVAMEKFNKILDETGTKSSSKTKTTTSTKKPQTIFAKYPGVPAPNVVLIRARQIYQKHPNRSRVSVAHNIHKEMYTPEEYAKLSLFEIAREVDTLEDFLKRAEKSGQLPSKKERDLSKLKKSK